MSKILTALAAAEENDLIALANKGLYKRAERELPEAGTTVTIDGETVTVHFADGTLVTLEGSIQNYQCTCPSRSICKHLLMAVLAARAEIRALPRERETEGAGEGEVLSATDASAPTVTSPAARLSASASSASSFTSAPSPDERAIEEERPPEFSTEALPYIRGFIVETLDTGLARLSGDTRGRFLQLATLCHSQRLANMERLCNRIAGQLEHFTNRSATFHRDWLLTDLCRLLFSCQEIEAGNTEKELIGVFKETYRPVPQLELWGLGAFGWQSTGGYRGVSVSFFCPGETELYTFTSALPVERAPDIQTLYLAAAPWGLTENIARLCRMRCNLKGGMVSGKRQLSASKGSTASLLEATPVMSPQLDPLRFDDFALLLETLWQRGETGKSGPMTAILMPTRIENSCYDSIEQRWSLTLRDKTERGLTLSVRYEQNTALLVSNLQYFESRGRLCQPMLAQVSLQGGELHAFPVTLYGEEFFNLSLDKPTEVKQERKALFDWGQ